LNINPFVLVNEHLKAITIETEDIEATVFGSLDIRLGDFFLLRLVAKLVDEEERHQS